MLFHFDRSCGSSQSCGRAPWALPIMGRRARLAAGPSRRGRRLSDCCSLAWRRLPTPAWGQPAQELEALSKPPEAAGSPGRARNGREVTLSLAVDELRQREAAELFRCLANPNRITILCALLNGDRAVSELKAAIRIRQPILSQQLAILREAGLVESTRIQKSIVYRLRDHSSGLIACVLRAAMDEAGDRGPSASASQPRGEHPSEAGVLTRVEDATND